MTWWEVESPDGTSVLEPRQPLTQCGNQDQPRFNREYALSMIVGRHSTAEAVRMAFRRPVRRSDRVRHFITGVLQDAMLIRFTPISVEKLTATAYDQHERDSIDGREPARFGISVFGDHIRSGETVDETIARICAEAPCNGRTVAAFDEADLDSVGLTVHDDIPPPMHYLIGNDDLSTKPAVERLAVLLDEKRTRNPAWTRR